MADAGFSMDIDDYDEDDRVHIVKTANRLSMAFTAWAIVVGVIGGFSLYFLNRIMEKQDNDHAALLIVKERQDNVLRRLDRLERDK